MELELHEVLDYKTHDIFIGELVQTHADEGVLNDGRIDIAADNFRRSCTIGFRMKKWLIFSLAQINEPGALR